ncbi:MAG: GAF domain-containing protein [Chloroflexota bacterium]
MVSPLVKIDRLNVLFELSLINSPKETIYDSVTVFASKVIGTPVSLVSMVADNYQYFKSEVGLPEPYKTKRRTPFSHSFCKHVVADNAPLIVTDARENDIVKHNLAIRDLDVIGYLGIPLTLSDGMSLGSLCVIDTDVREWTQVEIDIMTELAQIVIKEFDMRVEVKKKKASKENLVALQERIMQFLNAIDANQSKSIILEQIRTQRDTFNLA